eukprot:scaffold256661_cov16-Tisochrysis_lutea.AAC.1
MNTCHAPGVAHCTGTCMAASRPGRLSNPVYPDLPVLVDPQLPLGLVLFGRGLLYMLRRKAALAELHAMVSAGNQGGRVVSVEKTLERSSHTGVGAVGPQKKTDAHIDAEARIPKRSSLHTDADYCSVHGCQGFPSSSIPCSSFPFPPTSHIIITLLCSSPVPPGTTLSTGCLHSRRTCSVPPPVHSLTLVQLLNSLGASLAMVEKHGGDLKSSKHIPAQLAASTNYCSLLLVPGSSSTFTCWCLHFLKSPVCCNFPWKNLCPAWRASVENHPQAKGLIHPNRCSNTGSARNHASPPLLDPTNIIA